VTVENLQTAIDREARLTYTYGLFEKKAESEHMWNVARLYKALARSEEIHTNLHIALMKKMGFEPKPYQPDKVVVGTVPQTLRLSSSDEQIEVESMYPNLIQTAVMENLPEAVTLFKRTQTSDARHIELVKDALDKNGFISKQIYYICPCCGYILTSDKIKDCPDCHEAMSKFEKL